MSALDGMRSLILTVHRPAFGPQFGSSRIMSQAESALLPIQETGSLPPDSRESSGVSVGQVSDLPDSCHRHLSVAAFGR